MRLQDNRGGVEVVANHLDAGLDVEGTSGTGPFPEDSRAEIEGNTIGGDQESSGNVPAPSNDGQPNTATGTRTGQCVGL